jgi:hypothetical protein
VPFELGTVAMANSGKNCSLHFLHCLPYSPLIISSFTANTSQVRLRSVGSIYRGVADSRPSYTLTSDPAKLKKLTGKYVAFAQVDLADAGSKECLSRLDALADGKGGTKEPVWIEGCGVEE